MDTRFYWRLACQQTSSVNALKTRKSKSFNYNAATQWLQLQSYSEYITRK